jgi:hypothetical protein
VFRSTLVSIAETERRPPVRLDDHETIRDGGAILGIVDAGTAPNGKMTGCQSSGNVSRTNGRPGIRQSGIDAPSVPSRCEPVIGCSSAAMEDRV